MFIAPQLVVAQDAEPSREELAKQIAALQARIEELESKQQATHLSSAQVNEVVERVLRDADSRSKFGGGISWSQGKLLIQSADGNYVLHPSFQVQIRQATNARETADDWDVENGFEIRRMKFGFDGNVFSKDTTYNFLWATNRNTGNVSLEEAWVKQALTKEWSVLGGQFKAWFAKESMVSSKRLLAADRTLLTDTFTGGDNFVQGVSAIYARDAWRAQAAFHDGAVNNFNQNFRDFPTNNADFGAGGRAEIKFAGDWKAYDDFTALSAKEHLFVVGAAADYTEAGNTGFLLHTVDAMYKSPGGLALFGAFLGRYTTNGPVSPSTPTGPEEDLYDYGVIAQASYLLKNKWEPFVRFDLMMLDDNGLPAGTEDTVPVFTAGVNWYLMGHDSKFTLDIQYLPNGTPIADEGADILVNEDAEIVFRAQYQLLL